MYHLHVDSVSKSFNNKTILSDIFIGCKTGDIVGLIGRNGCGKSTLLKIIFGTEPAEYKYIRVNNTPIKSFSDNKTCISYLPQHHFLPNGITIHRLIKLFVPKGAQSSIINNAYIQPLLYKKNKELSGGEKRLIEILLIIHSEAHFILLDEPFNGISPIMKDYIIGYIKQMSASKGFIITDHDYQNVITVATTLVFLKNGYLKPVSTHNELMALGYLTSSAVETLK